MNEASKAVFLSYASQDAEAALRLCSGLRSAGVEVWFDQSELRGGDAWDHKLREQIAECTLFVPVISANTQARREGYFRLEWKLADERTHLMAEGTPFVVPVVIDDTKEREALLPKSFLRAQWTRLPGGEAHATFCERVKTLLGGSSKVDRVVPNAVTIAPSNEKRVGDNALHPRRPAAIAAAAVLLLVAGVWYWHSRSLASAPQEPRAKNLEQAASAASLSSDKSIAVLAFEDDSPAKDNESFADGISEELLNVLGKVPNLRVVGRTSSFYFKGKQVPMADMAKQLNVAYFVEGSVRRMGDQVRITAWLTKAADGSSVLLGSFDRRDLKDIFKIQDEIAGLIAQNLSLKLGANFASAKPAVNPEAFSLYLQGRQAWNLRTLDGFDRAEQLFGRAIALDSSFARARAGLADTRLTKATTTVSIGRFDQRDSDVFRRIVGEVEAALAIDPDCDEAHVSLATAYNQNWQPSEAEREVRRAISLNPNYATAHQILARIVAADGRLDEAIAEMKLATQLDPFSSRIHDNYAYFLRLSGRTAESISAAVKAIELNPQNQQAIVDATFNLAVSGSRTEALARLRGLGDLTPNLEATVGGTYAVLGMKAEAEARLPRAVSGLQRGALLLRLGRPAEALAALEAPSTRKDEVSSLLFDPVWDPIRNEPRFKQTLTSLGLTEAYARAQAWRAAHPPEGTR